MAEMFMICTRIKEPWAANSRSPSKSALWTGFELEKIITPCRKNNIDVHNEWIKEPNFRRKAKNFMIHTRIEKPWGCWLFLFSARSLCV